MRAIAPSTTVIEPVGDAGCEGETRNDAPWSPVANTVVVWCRNSSKGRRRVMGVGTTSRWNTVVSSAASFSGRCRSREGVRESFAPGSADSQVRHESGLVDPYIAPPAPGLGPEPLGPTLEVVGLRHGGTPSSRAHSSCPHLSHVEGLRGDDPSTAWTISCERRLRELAVGARRHEGSTAECN